VSLYRIEELSTTGWNLIESHQIQLTREQCKNQLEFYISQGYNPNLLRAVSDDDRISTFSTEGNVL
jgi:ribulose bisphosphate carboxylase small subunit